MRGKLVFVVCLSLAASACAQWTYVSANTVSQVANSESARENVSPSISGYGSYLGSMSCLGYLGPLGAYGPLASLGPLQQSNIGTIGNYASWLSSAFSSWFSSESSEGGMTMPTVSGADGYMSGTAITGSVNSLGPNGPLGANGPLGSAYNNMNQINPFAAQLAAQGLFTPLGPIGPLGALGPLGPLGSLSMVAGGYTQDSNGNLLSGGSVMRSINVDMGDGNTQSYELFEWYDEDFAASMSNNDASFMVRGQMNNPGDSKEFSFTSLVEQYVTVLATGEAQLDSIAVTLIDANSGQEITYSRVDATFGLINWIQILVPAGQPLTVRVECMSSSSSPLLYHPYRLFVIGSSSAISSTTITGPMIMSWTPSSTSYLTTSDSDIGGTPQVDNAVIAAIVASIAVIAVVCAIVVIVMHKRHARRNEEVDLEMQGSAIVAAK